MVYDLNNKVVLITGAATGIGAGVVRLLLEEHVKSGVIMVYDLSNKVVLITGAASGIGAGVVRLLLEENVKHVAVLDVAAEAGIAFQNEMNSKYGDNKVKFYKVDVSKDDQLLGAFKSVKDEQGYLDAVINNAGIMHSRLDTYKLQIDINVTAVASGTLKALELMRKDQGGKGGAVINVASVVAMTQTPLTPLYNATKSAVLQFSNCIGKEEFYSVTGVRVMAICFGATSTPLLDPGNMGSFNEEIEKATIKYADKFVIQRMESAASAVIECLKQGESGSTWLSTHDRPAEDVTDVVKKAYKVLDDAAFRE